MLEGFVYDDKSGINDDNAYIRVGEILHVWEEKAFYTVITASFIYRLFKSEEDNDVPLEPKLV